MARLELPIPVLVSSLLLACGGAGGDGPAAPGNRGGAPPACRLVEEGFGPDGEVALEVEVVAEGLEVPWGLGFLPGGELLVTERPGRIRLVRDGEVLEEPVAGVPAVSRAEGGLLGLALHPDFPEPRHFYIYYTARRGDRAFNRVERWELSDDATSASRVSVILQGIPAARFHDGGRIAFGPDGMLYVGTGDATEPARSQRLNTKAGKILRVTPEGEVPADNPWPDNPAFVTGVRNVEAFDWRGGEDLLVADHGPSGELGRTGHDEVSVVSAGDNLGWPVIYGCRERPGMVTPAITWEQAVPPGGAAFYRGGALPAFRGDLLLGTLGSEHLHRIRFAPDAPERVTSHEVYLRGQPPEGYGRLRTVIVGPDDALYVTTSNCDGRGACPPDGDKILRVTGG